MLKAVLCFRNMFQFAFDTETPVWGIVQFNADFLLSDVVYQWCRIVEFCGCIEEEEFLETQPAVSCINMVMETKRKLLRYKCFLFRQNSSSLLLYFQELSWWWKSFKLRFNLDLIYVDNWMISCPIMSRDWTWHPS